MPRPSTITPSILLVLLLLALSLILSPALETKDFKNAAGAAVDAVEEAAAAAVHAAGDAAAAVGHAASDLLHSAEAAAEDMLEAVESTISPSHSEEASPSLTMVYFGMPFQMDKIDFSQGETGTTVKSLKAMIEKEYKIPASEQMIIHDGVLLADQVKLASKSIGPGTTLEVRHKIAIKEGTNMPMDKKGFSPEEMKELFNIDLASFRAIWEAKQEAGKEVLKEGKALMKEKRNVLTAFVKKIGDFFQGLGRKVKEGVGKLKKAMGGWRKGGRKNAGGEL